jgi:glutamyl/glutaminyl-tRNA synthetase
LEERGSEELLPALELARRFRLEDVSHSAGVFDEDKLSWVNRHCLKTLAPARLVEESLPFLREAGVVTGPLWLEARAWLEATLPSAAASVDRLNQLPDRVHTVFFFDAARTLADPALSRELAEPGARQVVHALAAVLTGLAPLVDRDAFRAAAGEVRERTGFKGKALFHPIRVILTGAAEGPELDILVPAIDRAAALPADAGLPSVLSCRSRAAQVAALLPA